MQNFRALGAKPPDPQISPPLRISVYAPACLRAKSLSTHQSTRPRCEFLSTANMKYNLSKYTIDPIVYIIYIQAFQKTNQLFLLVNILYHIIIVK